MEGLAGAELVMSIHPKYQKLLVVPGVPKKLNIDEPVPGDVVRRLEAMPEFVCAFEPNGMKNEEFVTYGAAQRTLAEFIYTGWAPLEAFCMKK
jgi:Cytochrome c peroxidase